MKTYFTNMHRTATTLAVAGTLSLFAAWSATAQDQGGGRGPGGPGGPGGGRGGFSLDEQQRQSLREAMDKTQDDFQKLDDKLRAAQKELMKAVLAEKQDEKAIREKAEAMGKIQTDIIVLRSKAYGSITPPLKADQREQMIDSRISVMMLQGGFGGRGPGGPGGPGGRGPGGPGGAGGQGGRGPGGNR